jgi:hypothetical protein
VILGILVWAILGTTLTGYYFVQYNTYQDEYNRLVAGFDVSLGSISAVLEGISLRTDILISVGGASGLWHNDTVMPLGATAFTAVHSVADAINYTDYGGALGVLVTSINGVANNDTHGWAYWFWNSEQSGWTLPSYSAAKHILHEGDTIAFNFAPGWPPPPPA